MNKFSRSMTTQSGFTLIELMISMTLGLILTGAMVAVYSANQTATRATDNLSRMQESARLSFELMAREIREAAGTVCGKNLPVVNVLNNADTIWWSSWGSAIRGYGASEVFSGVAVGTAVEQRVAGTDAIQLISGSGMPSLTVVQHNASSAQFKINVTDHGLVDNDIVMVCDYSQASILQVTNVNSSNSTVVHNNGAGTPGNCTKGLGIPLDCSSTNGTPYEYGEHSQLVKLTPSAWYIGNSDDGTSSLFRLTPTGAQEIAPGVTSLQLTYLTSSAADYVDATLIADWSDVISVRVSLTIQSADQRIGTDGNAFSRTVSHIVTLRSRV